MFFAKAKGKRGEIYVYDPIGQSWDGNGITANSFRDTLKELGNVDALDIYINSPGGSVFEGLAIFNQIVRHGASEKIVHVDGIAASIASIIAMSGTEIRMAENAMMMIHNPWGMAIGGAADMRKQADALDKIRDTLLTTYVSRTKGKSKEIGDWMDEETWMTAKESYDRGFADKITDSKTVKAEFAMLKNFAKVPDQFKSSTEANMSAKMMKMQMRMTQVAK
ncbi:MAG: head maturation protease, ClpP-related [Fluviibacter phosphoraccumulans]